MEVMVGSSFGIGRLAYVRDRGGVSAQDKAVKTALFLADESGRGGSEIGIGLRMSNNSKSIEESEDSSSSIGESSDNEEDDEEDDVVSSQRRTLDSFSSSLEDSLPIKRGLSNHYVGKSKSFGNLMESASSAKDLEKAENPFNKKRRLLIANKLRRRSMSVSNIYTWQNPNSMPLLALQEQNQKDSDNDEDEDDDDHKKIMMMMKNKRELMAQTRSCFCLSSLQEEDDCDDEDEDE